MGLLMSATVEIARAGFRELLFLCCAYVLGQLRSPLPVGFSFDGAVLQEMVNCLLYESFIHGGGVLLKSPSENELLRSLPELD